MRKQSDLEMTVASAAAVRVFKRAKEVEITLIATSD